MNVTNFVSASKEVAIDLAMLLFSYQKIKMDDASTRKEIEMLDGEYGETLSRMQEIVDFAGQAQHTADMVCENLDSGLKLISAIMKEKTRILKTGTARAGHFNIGNYVSLN